MGGRLVDSPPLSGRCVLTRASFEGANLEGARFDDSSLVGCRFGATARLAGAFFADSRLDLSSFRGALMDGVWMDLSQGRSSFRDGPAHFPV